MAKFHGTLQGNRGEATRTGTSEIHVSAQSYDGSIGVRLYYNKQKELMVDLRAEKDTSTAYPYNTIFRGKFDDFLKLHVDEKDGEDDLVTSREVDCPCDCSDCEHSDKCTENGRYDFEEDDDNDHLPRFLMP